VDSNPSLATVAAFNKAAGDPLRLTILRVLAQDSYGVLELSRLFATKQSGMSHHLKVLANAGLVGTRREGNSIFYSRAVPDSEYWLCSLQRQLYATVDAMALSPDISAGLSALKGERAAISWRFFEQQDGVRAQQDLIAHFSVYGHAVADLLKRIPPENREYAVEVGPGEGEFLPMLAGCFEHVVALDNSQAMLNQSQFLCESHGVNNVDFICADTGWFTQHIASSGCVVMNMVLHHTPSPADIFMDIGVGLSAGGILLISELCHHDQDWAKEACGDLWLGFATDDLQRWGERAGLTLEQSSYLALRNGFQIQLLQFVKH